MNPSDFQPDRVLVWADYIDLLPPDHECGRRQSPRFGTPFSGFSGDQEGE